MGKETYLMALCALAVAVASGPATVNAADVTGGKADDVRSFSVKSVDKWNNMRK